MDYLYLPKILFKQMPECKGKISGSDYQGEILLYPFCGGSLIITAIRNLPDGFYRLKLYDSPSKEWELPSLLSSKGFSYSINFDGRFIPSDTIELKADILGADSMTFATGIIITNSVEKLP